jgi:hypothetical protein
MPVPDEERAVNKIDLNRVWDDARAMGRANRDMLTALAGMFVLLPGVVADQLVKAPEPAVGQPVPPQQAMDMMIAQFAHNWPVLLGHSLLSSFGALAMLVLLLRPERPTVADSMKAALVLLPGYFLASLLQGFAIGIGLVLLFVPGLYLIARFALVAPVVAAEGRANPIDILRRSIELTRGNGWRIFALLAVLFFTASILWLVIAVLVRIAGTLLLPAELAELALSLAVGLVEAALSAIVVLVSAGFYRAVTAPTPGLDAIFR